MESITLIEHESLPILPERLRGQNALATEHAYALKKLERRLPGNAFFWGHHTVKFANYCGAICLGNLSIEILPKIHGKETEPGACRKSLIKMLVRARRLKIQRGGTAHIELQKHSLLDVFILQFCDQLHAELMQGMIRHYVEKNENINVLRGRLRVEQQLKHNNAHKERLFCQYDELDADNTFNQVIKCVLRLMMKIAAGAIARKKLAEMLMRFDIIRDIQADLQMVDKLKFNRFTCRYAPIFQQCSWFLQGCHPDVKVGNNACTSLLFDMNKLFEAYVASAYKQVAHFNGLRMQVQGPQKYMVRRWADRDEQLFLMKPDMAFFDTENNIFSIADAKWKLLDDREKKLGISQSDLYQMSAYATRYKVDRLSLVYPKQKCFQNPIELGLQGTEARLFITPFDVSSNDSPEYMFLGGPIKT